MKDQRYISMSILIEQKCQESYYGSCNESDKYLDAIDCAWFYRTRVCVL